MSLSILTATKNRVKSCTKAKVEHLTCEWVIKGFKLFLQTNGERISSPMFRTINSKEKWRLSLFPEGFVKEDTGYVSVYLHLHLPPQEVGTIKINAHVEISIPRFALTRTFVRQFDDSKGCGYVRMIKKSELLKLCGSDDTFTILCKIDIPRETISEPIALTNDMEQAFDLQEGQLSQAFRPLFKEPKLSDVVVIVGTQKFPAHKLVLAARSPVFSAMFENKETYENLNNEVKIEKMEPAVVEAMLEFFYTDEVTNLEGLADGLLGAADKYDVKLLRSMCEKLFYKTLNKQNAAEILIHSDVYRSHKLKEHVMKFIADHFSDVVESESYKEMEEKYPALVKELVRSMAVLHKSKKKGN